ncbi:RagB/SusD family nutrient uptake outer membrane protein [Chitinophagaceae bacterium LB-8]|uniref:RagB/SusD family nutrient uptake outer membrane protein n=1 Tax=Paraflavisolibacter caeni TaxID=2982496 RepID=A0A9X2XZ08_9BACT|nr:RagB/SusD family nutrient uptake outer membrane protein [Paraflavisolibacter caeni]MCU7552011.1 RagB/SusD family nutrient uptake outer membrane protein [Paraflavisolibacter caeni]
MNFSKYISFCIAAISIVGIYSCKKLDEYNPSNPTADATWTTPQGFITNVNGAYSEQRAWYGKEDGILMSEAGTDLWFNQQKANFANQLTRYENFTPSASGTMRNAWATLWKGINMTNAGINHIDQAGFTDSTERNKRLAELRFLRAFYYWHVVETWGGVMLRTTETQSAELTAVRSSVQDFYNLIFDDLQYAAANLPNAWGDEYSRATKKSALGLLARAYLSRAYYSQGAEAQDFFTKARNTAIEVIDRKAEFGVDLWANYADLWKPANNKKNKEALYTISNSLKNYQTSNYDNNANRLHMWYLSPYSSKPGLQLSFEYGNDNQRRLMPTLALLDFYNDDIDARYEGSFRETYITNKAYTWTQADVNTYKKDAGVLGKTLQTGKDTALYVTKKRITNQASLPYVVIDRDSTYEPATGKIKGNDFVVLKKFDDPNRAATPTTGPNAQPGYNDIFVIRLAEMYMIAAEAEFQLSNKSEAANYINVLRTRAAKPGKITDMQITPDQVTLDFILDERAREFAGEHMRWFDLKRTRQLVPRIHQYNLDITAVQEYHLTRPVPQNEIDALVNGQEFGQTPGYN